MINTCSTKGFCCPFLVPIARLRESGHYLCLVYNTQVLEAGKVIVYML
jgi:hypothetical protein